MVLSANDISENGDTDEDRSNICIKVDMLIMIMNKIKIKSFTLITASHRNCRNLSWFMKSTRDE
jgi:hypothetical protein